VFLARTSILFNSGHSERWKGRALAVIKWLIIKLSCLSASGGFFFDVIDKTKFCWWYVFIFFAEGSPEGFERVETIELLVVEAKSMLCGATFLGFLAAKEDSFEVL
jgi:hypothetical protein